MPGGRKQFYTVGGRGLKPDSGYKNVAPGKFTKASTNRKFILGNQTRINADLANNTLRIIIETS